ncbi:glycosyltransferase family 62 protein [Neurospora crassa]|uniref:Mannan polymerase II complex ANP1 subunit n=4 Tax=Neurospora TaxID=5140 RepID=Q1K6S3_NEUCR|nr:mannan polymerase II complex ANP1 subunit [Neurospora crassa OR74A]KAK3493749.1 putative ANP1 protein [Neurospora crassa]KAK3500264.1 putative ANP1 protein [Neurospora hispaniola]EAA31570.3 mannan polymerase II complex ANP1 subunit [Neurospora crassa OR74A]KHE78896.1 glycosyltransferase family 62 protein [Neurospora crassa]CAD70999.1 probable ANP1 protein [Neurospora crassa]|eukprot:XP_960806.3 mannan polymerase II complex ANP1 subunit [Neurospora crassa OR74A]
MLLPKGGVSWKAARAQLPPARALWAILTKTRFLLLVAVTGVVLLLWRGISTGASEMQSFYCWGPSKPPMEMTLNEQQAWNAHLHTPVIFNHHAPLEINSSTISHVDLNPVKSTTKAVANEERILILTPLKDASRYLSKYFELIAELTYPHHLIDLAFLVSDSTDDTLAVLASELDRIQKRPDQIPFHSAMVVEKDFDFKLSQNVEERHSFAAQGPRRKAMGRARNYLLSAALKPEHSWVYWRDVDIVDSPKKILEDFIAHDKDILVPNIWFHRYQNGRDIEGRFDYNSWVESDKGRRLASSLDKDVVLAEGYKEYDTGRTYMARMGDWRDDKDVEIELDGIGGVNILVKADVHRSGINFPCYAFENQAETEGFAKMAKRAGYQVIGLPNYVVWHIDTEEKGGNA